MLPAAFSHAIFLAQVSTANPPHTPLDASNPTVFMGLLIGGIITLVVGADKIDGMVQRRKRQPALDSELVKFTAAIGSLEASVKILSEAKDKHAGHSLQLAQLERELREQKERADRSEASNRKYMMETTREIFAAIKSETKIFSDKVDALTVSMNKEFRDIAADIGALKEASENAKS